MDVVEEVVALVVVVVVAVVTVVLLIVVGTLEEVFRAYTTGTTTAVASNAIRTILPTIVKAVELAFDGCNLFALKHRQ